MGFVQLRLTMTSASGSRTGSARSSTASTSEKIAVLAPMPRPSDNVAAIDEARALQQAADAVADVLRQVVRPARAAHVTARLP